MPDASHADTFNQAKTHFFAGLAGLEARRFEEAEQHFAAALALVPGRVSTLVNLAATRVLLGRPDAALAVADQALAIEPDNHDAWLHRATALAGLSRYAEALVGFERALACDAGQSEVWSRQAQTLAALDRPQDALRAYERALAIDPSLPEVWSRYGEALREQGRLPDAARAFEQAIAQGGDAELHGYLLASVGAAPMPARAPERYVRTLFDGYAADFDQHLVGVLGYQAHAVLTRHLMLLAQGPFESAIDLGCGTGLCGPLVKPQVRHLTGVDLSEAMLSRASALGVYNELVAGDLLGHLTATRRRFDQVLAADVFNYVGELDAVFAAVRGATLPGAVFCFTAEVPPPDASQVRSEDLSIPCAARYPVLSLSMDQGEPETGAESDTQCANVGVIFPSRGRGTGFAGPQAQRPPRGAESDTQCANVGAKIPGLHLLPSLRYAHSEAYLRRLAARHGFEVLDVLRQPVRHDQRQPVDGLYLYLVKT